jgi:hypothetical protein
MWKIFLKSKNVQYINNGYTKVIIHNTREQNNKYQTMITSLWKPNKKWEPSSTKMVKSKVETITKIVAKMDTSIIHKQLWILRG